ncbi:MauE/DoxX family redox-associated membrane protein [uncultured Chitinophaga sp.]|uniref:MauE/DoxX family redox-associated membrane protein n=1 Tax=uncultured Chitinophaga sp. TaxID=339340 RepID=UPI00345BB79B
MKNNNIVLEVICCLLILLFGYTGISKILDYSTFSFDLFRSIPVLDRIGFPAWIALSIPVFELVIAAVLVVPRWRKLGLYASLFTMIFFTLYVAFILGFMDKKPCSCGGVLREMSWTQHLWFNVFFTIISYWGIAIIKGRRWWPIKKDARIGNRVSP